MRVQLKNALGQHIQLSMLSQQPLEMHIHVTLVGDKADGAVSQPLGAAHVLDCVAERELKDRDQAGEVGWGLGRLFLAIFERSDLNKIDTAAGRRLEWLFFV